MSHLQDVRDNITQVLQRNVALRRHLKNPALTKNEVRRALMLATQRDRQEFDTAMWADEQNMRKMSAYLADSMSTIKSMISVMSTVRTNIETFNDEAP